MSISSRSQNLKLGGKLVLKIISLKLDIKKRLYLLIDFISFLGSHIVWLWIPFQILIRILDSFSFVVFLYIYVT